MNARDRTFSGRKNFFRRFTRNINIRLGEFLENDTTRRFDYRVVMGMFFAAILGIKFLDTPNPSDTFIMCVTGSQVINTFGLNAEMITYLKAISGNYRQAPTNVYADDAQVMGGPVRVNNTGKGTPAQTPDDE